MSGDRPERKPPGETEPVEDLEILDVVVLDRHDDPPPSESPDEVEISFEEESAPPRRRVPPRPAAAAPQAPVPVLEATVLDDRVLRLQADSEDYQKRVERERIDHLRHATGSLMARLLPVLDNFDRAIAAAGPPCNDPVLDGIFMIQKQLLDELGLEGLRPMDSLGAPFDPALHEAVATVVDPSVPSHTVTLVFQRGYFLHDRVLRAALVRVSVDGPPGAGARADAQEA